ncbi:MAG: hypothetical protein K8R09_05135, partial [Desulfobacterales bacterium]|nr:hypothetical protein [Desulfobacterales bacterium]
PTALEGAKQSVYMDNDAHFAIVIPTGFEKMPENRLPAGFPDHPGYRKWYEDAIKQYDTTFVCRDRENETGRGDNRLVFIGIKTYKHEKKRLKIFTDYLTMDEFFSLKQIKQFSNFIKKRLVEKGAKDVIVKPSILYKDQNSFGFACSYRLPEGVKAKEFHRVFLGRTCLVYLDLYLYAAGDSAPYIETFRDVADSLEFEQGFEAKDSYVDASVKKVGSYELFGIRLSELGGSLLQIILIIFIFNLALDYFINPRKRRYKVEFILRNKKKVRIATVPAGILLYMFCSYC